MKKLITVLSLLTVLASAPPAMASGNYRAALDQKWKQVEAWQERQSAKFRALEREAAREINSFGSESLCSIPGRDIYPSCGQ